MEVPRHAVHENVARYHAAGVLLRRHHTLAPLRMPVLHLLLQLNFLLDEIHQRSGRSVVFVVRPVLLLVFEEPQRWERLNPLLGAQLSVGDAIDFDNVYSGRVLRIVLVLFSFLREPLPRRLKPLTPYAPWGKKIDKYIRIFGKIAVKIRLV